MNSQPNELNNGQPNELNNSQQKLLNDLKQIESLRLAQFLTTHDGLHPSPTATTRVKRDLKALFTDPPPGIFVTSDESDFMTVHALIIGPYDTPYEGGFFYFILKCPADYPIQPPKVRFMTTHCGTVRFNPNLYKTGKVCLSILGTYEGPAWSPAQQLSSLLISIQSLLNEKPYHNEPGFNNELCVGDAKRYNEIIQHETLRVAVIGMVLNETSLSIPTCFIKVMEKSFLQFYDHYVETAKNNLHLDGQKMVDPFRDERGTFQYKLILKRLEELHAKISEKHSLLPEEPSCSNGNVLSNDDKQDSPDSSDSSLSACSSSELPIEL